MSSNSTPAKAQRSMTLWHLALFSLGAALFVPIALNLNAQVTGTYTNSSINLTVTNSGTSTSTINGTSVTSTSGSSTSGGGGGGGGGGGSYYSSGSFRPTATGTTTSTTAASQSTITTGSMTTGVVATTGSTTGYVAQPQNCGQVQLTINPDNLDYTDVWPKTGFVPGQLRDAYGANSIFPDTSADHPYYQSAVDLFLMGVVDGYNNDGTMALNDSVNRAQVAKMISIATESLIETGCGSEFPDVPQTAWFNDFVRHLAMTGTVSGFPTGEYGPAQSVNYGQMLKIVARSFNFYTAADVQGGAWQTPYYETLRQHNIIPAELRDSTDFGLVLTRGQVMDFIARAVRTKYMMGDVYPAAVDVAIPEAGIYTTATPSLPSDASVWLSDLTHAGSAYYYDPVDRTHVVWAHSSVWGFDPGPGAVFQPLLTTGGVGTTIEVMGQQFEVYDRMEISENQIGDIRDAGADLILFTCRTDITERVVLKARRK